MIPFDIRGICFVGEEVKSAHSIVMVNRISVIQVLSGCTYKLDKPEEKDVSDDV